MNMTLVWIALGLLTLLLLSPTITFLCAGWERRRRHIIDGFSDDAITAYFRAFQTQAQNTSGTVRERFNAYYCLEIGRHLFVWPLLLLAGIAGLLFYWSAPSLSDLLQHESVDSGKLPALALVAFMGAYMWVLFDSIIRWYSADLSPADIYWWCFRLAIAVPMGYAAKDIFNESLARLLVFLLGAFPTTKLMSIAKRIATQKLGFKEDASNEVSELQNLQGVDMRRAEQFEAEGLTTILQLAYADPIRTTIRTGFSYSYIVDCTCQALLWIYAEKEADMPIMRRSGLRSGYEVLYLWLEFQEDDKKAAADQLMTQVAQDLGRSVASVKNIFEQVSLDPYTQFLFLSWSGYTKEEIGPKGCRVLNLK